MKDNQFLSFTMFGEDFKRCRRYINKETTKTYYNLEEGEQYPSRKLPLSERWSARKFDFSIIFREIDETDAVKKDIDWYYGLDNWANYRAYLGSENFIQKPADSLTRPHHHDILCDEGDNKDGQKTV